MNTPPTWVERVLDALTEDGRRSVRQLTYELQSDLDFESARKGVNSAIRILRKQRHIYVAQYVRRQEPGMQRPYPVALFAVGPWRDAKPIGALSNYERCKAYREKQRKFVPSVFHLSSPFTRGRQRRIGNGFNAPESL